MQFTQLGRSNLFEDFAFEGNFFKTWPLKNYIILGGLGVFGYFTVKNGIVYYQASDMGLPYLGFFLFVCLYLVVALAFFHSFDEMHIHHY